MSYSPAVAIIILLSTLPRGDSLFGRWLAPRSGDDDDDGGDEGVVCTTTRTLGGRVDIRYRGGGKGGAKRGGGGGDGGVLLAPTATDRLPAAAAARLGHTVAADADDAPRRFSVVALYSRRTLCCLVYGTTTAATADANGHDAF